VSDFDLEDGRRTDLPEPRSSFRRRMPSTAASYSDSASTLAEWRSPRMSLKLTMHGCGATVRQHGNCVFRTPKLLRLSRADAGLLAIIRGVMQLRVYGPMSSLRERVETLLAQADHLRDRSRRLQQSAVATSDRLPYLIQQSLAAV